MNPNETRSSHPSSAQVETLEEYMERNPGMAKGFLRTQNVRERSRRHRQWEELAVRQVRPNSLGSTIKNYKQWTKNIKLEHTPRTYHPSPSPPPITRSHTWVCVEVYVKHSPSLRGSTQVTYPVTRRRTAASSFSRHATQNASPSRRPRTNMTRASRRAGSVSSRHTSLVAAPPPSQQRTEFSTITERFLRLKEQQLEIQRHNTQILQSFLRPLERSAERERAMDEGSAERDRILAEAVASVKKGLQALVEAKNRDRLK